MTPLAYARNLARLLAPYRGTAALVGALLLVDVVFSAAWPLSFKFLIDRITRAGDPRFLTVVVGALFAAVLVSSLAAVLRDYGYALLGSRVLRDVRRAVFEHLQRMSLAFFQQKRAADLLARFSSDLARSSRRRSPRRSPASSSAPPASSSAPSCSFSSSGAWRP